MQRRLGGIARDADLGFCALSFAFETVPLDKAVAQHAQRSRHCADLVDACRRHRDVEFAARDRSHASLQLLQGDGDRAHGQGSEAQREHQCSDSAHDRELNGELSLARRRIAPGNGLLLDPVDDPVDRIIDPENVAFCLLQEGVAGGAVVA